MRWLRNIFALLAIACVILWATSYSYLVQAYMPIGKGGGGMSWHSAHGRVMLFIDSKPFTTISYHWDIDIYRFPSSDNRKEFWVHALKEPDNGSSFAFERFYVTGMSGGLIHRLIMFPLWLPTLLLSLWPAIALTRHIKRRYFSPGICRNCGYDLRGTPSGVCPECGRTSNVPPDKESTPAKIEA